MKHHVRVSNPDEQQGHSVCEAVLDLGPGSPRVPMEVYENLNLPGAAVLEFEGRSTWMGVRPSSDAVVHISLAMLTALNLEMNRSTGELRSFEPFLHYPIMVEEETS